MKHKTIKHQKRQNDRTHNSMANKHSTAFFRPVPSISSYRIIKSQTLFIAINGEQTNTLATVILDGPCYFIIK